MTKLLKTVLVMSVCVLYVSAQDKTQTSNSQVLLALENTIFKKSLIDQIKKLLEEKKYDVKIVDHSKKQLDSIKPSDYDVIFITNSGVNSKVRPWVLNWLEKYKGQTESVIVHTTQKFDWEVKLDVDALTSASKKGDIDKLARQYSEKIIGKIETTLQNDENITNE